MRFSFTCILSFFLLVTIAAAIPVPREGQPASSLSRRDSYDDVVELHARAETLPAPHHDLAWGKTKEKKLPTKSKQQRKEEHTAQKAVAGKTRHDKYLKRQESLAKHNKQHDPVTTKRQGKVARKKAVLAKKTKVQAKAKSTQLEAKQRLALRKEAGRKKFDTTREKYKATAGLPDRKTTFTTPGGQKFTGADARRAVWNSHHFAENPVNSKPAEFRNNAGSATNPQRIIKTMENEGTEFPINNHKHGFQGRPQPVKQKGQNPKPENPGPARAIVEKQEKEGEPAKYIFHGVVSHDESKKGQGKSGGEHGHHHIIGEEPGEAQSGEAMQNLFG